MQEDKEPLFDADRTVRISLAVFTRVVRAVRFERENMAMAAEGGFACATECADYLAKKGVPFRSAHEAVGKLVLHCISTGKTLRELSLDEYKRFSPAFDKDILDAVDAKNAVKKRTVTGGCAPDEVKRQIQALRDAIK